MKTIRVSAPATVANVSVGFDIFGFAIEAPADEVAITLTSDGIVTIREITGDKGCLPIESDRNTAGVAVREYLRNVKSRYGADIFLHKGMPLGSGMGSSAASAVAALVAVNALHDSELTREALLPFALEAERTACGAGHADNAAPSLLGGFVLIRGYDPLDVVHIPIPPDVYCTLVHPDIEVKTHDARRVMKSNISMADAVRQWGNIAGLVVGLMKPDYELISRSLQDVIAEPVRSLLIPGFDRIKQSALHDGALGCGISGSGPTMFALSRDKEVAGVVGAGMQKIFADTGLSSAVFVSKINNRGAQIISS